jgi:hypothetical protein
VTQLDHSTLATELNQLILNFSEWIYTTRHSKNCIKLFGYKSVYGLSNKCSPILESIFFTAFRPNPSEAFENGIHDAFNNRDNGTVHPFPSVKSFNGDRIMLTNATVIYLMCKFPNLARLTLNREGSHQEEIYDEEDEDMVTEEAERHDEWMERGIDEQRFDIIPALSRFLQSFFHNLTLRCCVFKFPTLG